MLEIANGHRAAVFAVVMGFGCAVATAAPPAKVDPDHAKKMRAGLDLFRAKVRPVLLKKCLECHGGDATLGKLDLSTREKLLASGVIKGEAKATRMMQSLRHLRKPKMPQDQPKLDDATLKQIEMWIALGAPYDKPLSGTIAETGAGAITAADRKFWSFQRLRTAPPPKINSPWIRTDIDRFAIDKMRTHGLSPNPVAAKRVLIRRAYFDLLGLPPTPEEVDAFVNSTDPKAWEKLIDKLLKSPHYGERWARHWMDVSRFAESHGYEQDYDRKNAWPYRDFLIRALNSDMPFDQFVRWQLAGDELAPDDPLAMSATGFLGGGSFPTQLTEAEFERSRYDELDDMVATTGVAFLGLSVGCARCHTHKFDPIPSADYYRLASVFTTTIRSEIDLQLPSGKAKVQVSSEGYKHMKHHADGRGFPHFYKVTHYLSRGDVHQKQDVAEPGYLQVLMRDDKTPDHWEKKPPAKWKRTSFRRAGLADWITDVEHGAGHLAARVIVNRVWQHHFGEGIVATPNDFGRQGTAPTHPELLDWLARDLIANGWKLKRLHKLIMTSAVYMQGIETDAKRLRIDPNNKWLWRRTPRRLEAEAIRDSILAVAGELDRKMFGPGTLDQRMKRRSVYFFIKRSKLIPMMVLFDWPEHLVSIGKRSQTTIAPQALLFLNNSLIRGYAKSFSARVKTTDATKFVQEAFRLALGRSPSKTEAARATLFLKRQEQRYRNAKVKDAAQTARTDLCQAMFAMNEFLFVD